jgi:hypothetical protein
MNENYYKKVEQNVLKQFNSKEYIEAYNGTEQEKTDKNHFFEIINIVTWLWAEKEKSELPTALKIAALCHDVDRIYPKREVNTKNCSKSDYVVRKMLHSANSALLFCENNSELPKSLLDDISYLIFRHEIGGDKDKNGVIFNKKDEFTNSYNLNLAANYLFYADKICFFYTSIYEYKKRGKERLKYKIEFSLKGLPDWIKNKIFNISFNDKLINECIKEFISSQ